MKTNGSYIATAHLLKPSASECQLMVSNFLFWWLCVNTLNLVWYIVSFYCSFSSTHHRDPVANASQTQLHITRWTALDRNVNPFVPRRVKVGQEENANHWRTKGLTQTQEYTNVVVGGESLTSLATFKPMWTRNWTKILQTKQINHGCWGAKLVTLGC